MGTWTIYTSGADITLIGLILNGVAMICAQATFIWGFAVLASLWQLVRNTTAGSIRAVSGQGGVALSNGLYGVFIALLLAMALTAPGMKCTVQVENNATGAVTVVSNVPFVIAVIPAAGSLMASNVGTLVTTAFSASNPNYDIISASGNGFLDPMKRLLGARTAMLRLGGLDTEVKAVTSACLGPDSGVDYTQINSLVLNAGNSGATAAQTVQINGSDSTALGALLFQASQNINAVVLNIGVTGQTFLNCPDAVTYVVTDINNELASAEFARVIQGAVNGLDQAQPNANYALAQFQAEYDGVRAWSAVPGNLAGGQTQANSETMNWLFAELVANNLNCLQAWGSDKTQCEASMIQANEVERNNIQAASNEVPMLKYAGSFGSYILALIIGLGPVVVMFMMLAGVGAGKSMRTVAHIVVWPLLVTNVGAELVNGMISIQFSNFLASVSQGGFLSLATMGSAYKELSLQVGTGSHIMASLPVLMSMIFALGETAALVSVANEVKPKGTEVGQSMAPSPTDAAPLVHASAPINATQMDGSSRVEPVGALKANSATMAAGELAREFSHSDAQAHTQQDTTSKAFKVAKDWQESVRTGNFSRFGMDRESGYRINSLVEDTQGKGHSERVADGTTATQNNQRGTTLEASGGVGLPGGGKGGLLGISAGTSAATRSAANDTKEHHDTADRSDTSDYARHLAKAFQSDEAQRWTNGQGGDKAKEFRAAQSAVLNFDHLVSDSHSATGSTQDLVRQSERLGLAAQSVGTDEIQHGMNASRPFARYQTANGGEFDRSAEARPYLERAREEMRSGAIGNVQGSMGEREAVVRMRAASHMAVDGKAPAEQRTQAARFLAGAYRALTGIDVAPPTAAEATRSNFAFEAANDPTGINAAALMARRVPGYALSGGSSSRAEAGTATAPGVMGSNTTRLPGNAAGPSPAASHEQTLARTDEERQRVADLARVQESLDGGMTLMAPDGTVEGKVKDLLDDAKDSGLNREGDGTAVRAGKVAAGSVGELVSGRVKSKVRFAHKQTEEERKASAEAAPPPSMAIDAPGFAESGQ
jgi:conjugal transfer mating pair stabilization protein TraG